MPINKASTAIRFNILIKEFKRLSTRTGKRLNIVDTCSQYDGIWAYRLYEYNNNTEHNWKPFISVIHNLNAARIS